MKMLDCYLSLAKLLRFKEVSDADGNVYVLFENSDICHVEHSIEDKTAFEAVENHCHLIDHLSSNDFSRIIDAAMLLGKILYWSLKSAYSEKRFVVFVTADRGDSLTIRFHQQWEGEDPYYSVKGWDPTQTLVIQVDETGSYDNT